MCNLAVLISSSKEKYQSCCCCFDHFAGSNKAQFGLMGPELLAGRSHSDPERGDGSDQKETLSWT